MGILLGLITSTGIWSPLHSYMFVSSVALDFVVIASLSQDSVDPFGREYIKWYTFKHRLIHIRTIQGSKACSVAKPFSGCPDVCFNEPLADALVIT